MTFEEFYASEVAPGLPSDFPPALAAQAKKQLAVCWNTALDAAVEIPKRYMEESDTRNACNGIILNQKLLYAKP